MDSTLSLIHAFALQHLQPFVERRGTDEERYQLLLAMKPRDEDFGRLFQEPLLSPARALYAALWRQPPPLLPKPGQNHLWIRTASSEDFVAWNARGQEFPGGYRKLGPHLGPELAWVAFKFVIEGDFTGLSFDGLVWLDNRFAWFPQPWRLVPMGPA